jgi:hypothetical protein
MSPDLFKKTGIPLEAWEKIYKVFEFYPNLQNVILFGSRALGRFKPASDIDLCLIGDKLNFIDLSLIEEKIDNLMLPWKFDIVLYSFIDNEKLKEHIDLYGIELFN